MDNKFLDELKGLKGAIEESNSKVKSLVLEKEKSIKRLGETTEEIKSALDSEVKRNQELFNELKSRLNELESKGNRLQAGEKQETPGETFVKSVAFEQLGKGQYNTDWVEVKFAQGTGNLTPVHRVDRIVELPRQELTVRSLFGRASTSSDSIEYVEEVEGVNAAAFVKRDKKAASASTTAFPALPESTVKWEKRTTPVRDIGTWVPVPTNSLKDAGRLQHLINGSLLHYLGLAVERELLYGSGSEPNIKGVLTHEGIQTYDRQADDTILDVIRKAITVLDNSFLSADGLLLNPTDYEEVELTKGLDGHYIFLEREGKIWQVPVVRTATIDSGTALLGSFRRGATVYDREVAQIRVATQHMDFATRGLAAVIAEERLGFAIEVPRAFVKINLDVGGSGD